MNAMRVGLLIGAALALQACAGGPGREAGYSDADRLILGVMTPEEQSCPKHLTMLCTGSGRINLQCSCEDPQSLASALGMSSYGW